MRSRTTFLTTFTTLPGSSRRFVAACGMCRSDA